MSATNKNKYCPICNKRLILDEKEYSSHKQIYSYGERLDKVLHIEMQKILDKMHKREFPFQDDVISSYYSKFLRMIKKWNIYIRK